MPTEQAVGDGLVGRAEGGDEHIRLRMRAQDRGPVEIDHGMVMMALAIPGMATHRTTAAPFGATAPQEWSLPALGAASIAMAFLEPDPAIEWDSERIARVRQALTEITAAEA